MDSESFVTNRPRLLGLAYRMLGSAAEAEDVVQDAWLRLSSSSGDDVRNPAAWLTTVVSRLCLDRMKSARAKREVYAGPWLPEPVFTPEPLDVGSISVAFLILLEQLTATERAVFLLKQVFDYSHAEIAEMLGITAATSRQSLSRGSKHLEAGRPRFVAAPDRHAAVVSAFAEVLRTGDVDAISTALAEEVQFIADSGGKVSGAARREIRGAQNVAAFLAGLVQRARVLPAAFPEVSTELCNGVLALVGRQNDAILFVMAFETDGERVTAVYNSINPDKLKLREVP